MKRPQAASDRDLLIIQAEALLDEEGRLANCCGIMLGTARDGHVLLIGDRIPPELAVKLRTALKQAPVARTLDDEPPALASCRSLLEEACGPLDQHDGPYYVFGDEVRVPGSVQVLGSSGPGQELLRDLNPGNWDPNEWDCLIDGTLGPWAMGLADGQVVSICHTPRPLSERAAECGVWTHPDYRRRGHAATVTAAWADILRPSGRFLFYSTSRDNTSSQHVAARLGLRLFGWTWNLRSTPSRPRMVSIR
ncbi:MAG: GNAT family N-acetyltransferase [Chloroflexi bacterium]|nr:GNAT family N-acetyltransferase [Chloroflexota bacterium]